MKRPRFIATMAVVGCLFARLLAQQPQAPAQESTAAVIDGRVITLAEVDALTRTIDYRKAFELNYQLYDLREQALNQLIAERLLDRAAEQLGLTRDAYVSRSIPSLDVTESEVFLELFNSGRARTPADLETSKPAVTRFLQEQKRKAAMEALIGKLKQEADHEGKSIDVRLDPPRINLKTVPSDPVRGSGAIEIVEFADFQCPYCGKAAPQLKALLRDYDGKIKLVWKDAPMPTYPNAIPAALAGRCAADQGKFWELHDVLFANQGTLDTASMKRHAETAGLNTVTFDQCMTSATHSPELIAWLRELSKLPIMATPTFLVNGRVVRGAVGPELLKKVIDQELHQRAN